MSQDSTEGSTSIFYYFVLFALPCTSVRAMARTSLVVCHQNWYWSILCIWGLGRWVAIVLARLDRIKHLPDQVVASWRGVWPCGISNVAALFATCITFSFHSWWKVLWSIAVGMNGWLDE